MKKILLLLGISFIFLQSCGNSEDNLKFDINLGKLDYTLPTYTKLCIPDRKEICGSNGCEDIKPTTFLAYDEENNMIYRCDDKPCDSYEITTNQSGIYTYIEPTTPRGFGVKISNENKYIETVSFGMETLISYGKCQ